jgi:hypothetical protein
MLRSPGAAHPGQLQSPFSRENDIVVWEIYHAISVKTCCALPIELQCVQEEEGVSMAAFQTYAHLSRCGFTARRLHLPWMQSDGNIARIQDACSLSTTDPTLDSDSARTGQAADVGRAFSSGHTAPDEPDHGSSRKRTRNNIDRQTERVQPACALQETMPDHSRGQTLANTINNSKEAPGFNSNDPHNDPHMPAWACQDHLNQKVPHFRFAMFQPYEGCSRKDPPSPSGIVCVQTEHSRHQGLGLSDILSAVDGVAEGVPVCFSYVVGSDVFFVQCKHGVPALSFGKARLK